ncbi:hypothetical protein RKE29_01930 [Streptomyces sp. B1866]|uniref:hypothetical protein n=1 Tax=Streptomyces sp. B1866 TaxID=3075431 RepID=UPI00288D4E5B|nr:hypothetical protein [Streptomyces sp. B1866]MDT3395419.1 hypothetical protein [Streptomyces sp. B1866]
MIGLPFLPLIRLTCAAGRRAERTRRALRLARLAACAPPSMYLERWLGMDVLAAHALLREADETGPGPDDPDPD